LYVPEGEKRRPLRKRTIDWARRLLHLTYREGWYLDKDWRERLELFGIDPETLKIVDQQRFSFVWSDLKRGQGVSKHRQQLRINRLEESEPVAPFVEFQG
jgi:hypothetical protein